MRAERGRESVQKAQSENAMCGDDAAESAVLSE